MKPCSDVDEKTRSKFIGRVHKNTAVSTLRCSLTHDREEVFPREEKLRGSLPDEGTTGLPVP